MTLSSQRWSNHYHFCLNYYNNLLTHLILFLSLLVLFFIIAEKNHPFESWIILCHFSFLVPQYLYKFACYSSPYFLKDICSDLCGFPSTSGNIIILELAITFGWNFYYVFSLLIYSCCSILCNPSILMNFS